jgi:hypothetical protein
MMMREYSTEMVSSGRILSFSAVADELSSGEKKNIPGEQVLKLLIMNHSVEACGSAI